MDNNILTLTYTLPCGTLLLGDFGGRLCLADWPGHRATARVCRMLGAGLRPGHTPLLAEAAASLDAYVRGDCHIIERLPLLMPGTELQRAVWDELRRIPCGSTVAYGELARRVGRPRAVRAVAGAVGANALSLFVPCHRVVAATGLGGYAGGLAAKRWLLSAEKQPAGK